MAEGLRVRRGAAVMMVVAIANALVACGGDTPPAEAVPALADRLERVDAAIADDRPDRARRAVEALVDETIQARVDGSITADQADQILRAAGELLERLGTETHDIDPEPTDPPTTSPPPIEESDEDEGEPSEDDGEEDDREPKDKDKDKDNGEGKGNGPPEGNGPEDGHGN